MQQPSELAHLETHDATHNPVLTNSVGKLVMSLSTRYLQHFKQNYATGAERLAAQAEEKAMFEQTVTALMALKAEDFFKQSEFDEAGKLMNSQSEALRQHIAAQLPELIKFIIAKANEAPNQWDRVILYLPDKEGEYSDKEYILELKLILPLLWCALNDDTRFKHQYDNDEAKAHEDRPLRLLSFFRCCERIKAGICHHGVRNELLLLLNGIYNDGPLLEEQANQDVQSIKILEDAAATIYDMVREQISQQFAHRLSTLTIEERHALYHWMSDSDPSQLLDRIGGTEPLKTALFELFRQNGCNPETLTMEFKALGKLSLGQYMDYVKTHLGFSADFKRHPELAFINSLLNAPTSSQPPTPRDEALKKIKLWVKDSFDFTPEKVRTLSRLYTIYQTHQDLQKYQILLTIDGKMSTENIQSHVQAIEHYYAQVAVAENPILPLPENALIQRCHDVNKILTVCKSADNTAFVENYFALWFTKKYGLKPTLYQALLDEKVQQKIILTDDKLNYSAQSLQTQEAGITYQDLTPYLINRLFLHAIIVEPKEWTPTFAQLFARVLVHIGNLTQETSAAMALKQASYPKALIDELHYLHAMYLFHKQPEEIATKPTPPIMSIHVEQPPMMPKRISTGHDWLRISNFMNEPLLQKEFNKNGTWILKKLHETLTTVMPFKLEQDTVELIIDSLPPSGQLLFIKQRMKQLLTKKFYEFACEFSLLMRLLDPAQRCEVFNTLDTKKLAQMFVNELAIERKGMMFKKVMLVLNFSQRDAVFRQMDIQTRWKIRNIFLETSLFSENAFQELLSDIKTKDQFEWFSEDVMVHYTAAHGFSRCMTYVTPAKRASYYASLGGAAAIIKLIRLEEITKQDLSDSDGEQLVTKKLSEFATDFERVMQPLDQAQRCEIFNTLGAKKIAQMIVNDTDGMYFNGVMSVLDVSQREAVFNQMDFLTLAKNITIATNDSTERDEKCYYYTNFYHFIPPGSKRMELLQYIMTHHQVFIHTNVIIRQDASLTHSFMRKAYVYNAVYMTPEEYCWLYQVSKERYYSSPFPAINLIYNLSAMEGEWQLGPEKILTKDLDFNAFYQSKGGAKGLAEITAGVLQFLFMHTLPQLCKLDYYTALFIPPRRRQELLTLQTHDLEESISKKEFNSWKTLKQYTLPYQMDQQTTALWKDFKDYLNQTRPLIREELQRKIHTLIDDTQRLRLTTTYSPQQRLDSLILSIKELNKTYYESGTLSSALHLADQAYIPFLSQQTTMKAKLSQQRSELDDDIDQMLKR